MKEKWIFGWLIIMQIEFWSQEKILAKMKINFHKKVNKKGKKIYFHAPMYFTGVLQFRAYRIGYKQRSAFHYLREIVGVVCMLGIGGGKQICRILGYVTVSGLSRHPNSLRVRHGFPRCLLDQSLRSCGHSLPSASGRACL